MLHGDDISMPEFRKFDAMPHPKVKCNYPKNIVTIFTFMISYKKIKQFVQYPLIGRSDI